MRIDKSHRGWAAVTVALFLASAVAYWLYVKSAPDGPSGASWQGMSFGIAGTLLMLYAGLLALRKKVPRLRIGRAETWLKGHIWLGLLSVPLVLFHAGFSWEGTLDKILLIVLGLVVASGLFGLVVQYYVPRSMKAAAPLEAIYEQVPRVCAVLTRTADEAAAVACGSLLAVGDGAASRGDDRDVMSDFYRTTVRPFLAEAAPRRSRLHDRGQAVALFTQVRNMVSPSMHDTLDKLMAICEERRQLAVQVRMHYWLHGWLFLHVPLSMTLLVMVVIHVLTKMMIIP